MARVTVEDCVTKVPNRFELVMLAAQRARNLGAGVPLSLDRDNDRNPVVALREIAEGLVDTQALLDLGATELQIQTAQLAKGAGCATCNNTGYKGRVALYEVMKFTDDLKEMVLQGASTAELKVAAIKNSMSTLRMSGIKKVLAGVTTPEEVLRVTMAD